MVDLRSSLITNFRFVGLGPALALHVPLACICIIVLLCQLHVVDVDVCCLIKCCWGSVHLLLLCFFSEYGSNFCCPVLDHVVYVVDGAVQGLDQAVIIIQPPDDTLEASVYLCQRFQLVLGALFSGYRRCVLSQLTNNFSSLCDQAYRINS